MCQLAKRLDDLVGSGGLTVGALVGKLVGRNWLEWCLSTCRQGLKGMGGYYPLPMGAVAVQLMGMMLVEAVPLDWIGELTSRVGKDYDMCEFVLQGQADVPF